MKKVFPVLIVLSLFIFVRESFSQNEDQYYSTIEKNDQIIINDDFSVEYILHEKLTVLKSEGWGQAVRRIYTNPTNRLISFEAIVTHPVSGKTIKKFKLKDLTERTYLDDVNIFTDSKIKTFEPSGIAAPFVIEFKIVKKSEYNFFIEDWYPSLHFKQKVKHANLKINYPTEIGLRYKMEHLIADEKIEDIPSGKSITWSFEDLPILDPDEEEVAKIVLVPDQFKLGENQARMDSWENLGRFIYQLNEGKDQLPEDFKIQVHRMVEGIDDEFEKMAVLYKYVQENYRYVAISLGIGGWEPRNAEEVIKTKYGECKALTTLMKAMLQEVGIASQYTLVYAGSDYTKLNEEFPQNTFNHAFLRVPIQDEVYWLETTSRTLPPGFSGNFTKDRQVLVVNADGGVLEKTPDFSDFKFNSYHGEYHVDLNSMGDGIITGTARFDGFLALPFIESQYYKGEKELKINLIEGVNANNLFLKSIETSSINRKNVPQVIVNFEGFFQKYVQQTGKRIILSGNFLQVDVKKFENEVFRAQESIIVKLESDFEIESGAGKQVFAKDYFTYTMEVEDEIDQISIKNTLEVKFPKGSSKELKARTLNEFNQLSKQSIILKKL